jgi:hypothetical protein
MGLRFHLPLKGIFLIITVGALSFSILLFDNRQPILAAVPSEPQIDFNSMEAAMIAGTNVEPDLLDYLANHFCLGDLCRSGSWAEWIILAPDSTWEIADLLQLRTVLNDTMNALNDAGFDGYGLLSGYRFRHSQGIYLPGELGILARVHHEEQEIVLSDGALRKQWGFYMYHELGHVADRRLGSGLMHEFQRLTRGGVVVEGRKTADGYWLNRFAREKPEEATADAFALWIVLNHTNNPQPVLWLKPEDTSYETITGVMDSVLQGIAKRIQK